MKKIIGLLLLSLTLCPSVFCDETAIQLIKQADTIYLNRLDISQAKEALSLYEKAVIQDQKSVEALWKASRASWWVADHLETKAEKIKHFQNGIDWAKQSVALDPNSADGHFWLGGNYGSFGEVKGVLKSLALVKPIRHEMAEVIRIDPNYQGGAGYRVLGVVDYKVPGFAGGSKKRALEELNKALAIDPKSGFNRYYMAEYYETVGKKEKAREHLQILNSLTASPEDMPDLVSMQQKGKKLSEKLD